jgi:hypothetical protein
MVASGGDTEEAGQIRSGATLGSREGGRWSGGDDAAAFLARPWSDIDYPVAGGDHTHVVRSQAARAADSRDPLRAACSGSAARVARQRRIPKRHPVMPSVSAIDWPRYLISRCLRVISTPTRGNVAVPPRRACRKPKKIFPIPICPSKQQGSRAGYRHPRSSDCARALRARAPSPQVSAGDRVFTCEIMLGRVRGRARRDGQHRKHTGIASFNAARSCAPTRVTPNCRLSILPSKPSDLTMGYDDRRPWRLHARWCTTKL